MRVGTENLFLPSVLNWRCADIRRMAEIDEAAHLRQKAAGFRRLAKDHAKAGARRVSGRLTQVAANLEAQADELERRRSSGAV
jgi:hypothetical protein